MIDGLVQTGIGRGVRQMACGLFSCRYSLTLAVRLHMATQGELVELLGYAYSYDIQYGGVLVGIWSRGLLCVGGSSSGVEDLGGSTRLAWPNPPR